MITSEYLCECGCGEAVTVTDLGFLETSVTMAPCTSRRKRGVTGIQLRKSALMELTPANEPIGYTYGEGMVVMHVFGRV